MILFSVRSLRRPQGHTTAGTIESKKIPVTPSGIENMTFLLVAQCVNQLRHRVPLSTISTITHQVLILRRETYREGMNGVTLQTCILTFCLMTYYFDN